MSLDLDDLLELSSQASVEDLGNARDVRLLRKE